MKAPKDLVQPVLRNGVFVIVIIHDQLINNDIISKAEFGFVRIALLTPTLWQKPLGIW